MGEVKKNIEVVTVTFEGTGRTIESAIRILFSEGSLRDKDLKVKVKIDIDKKDLHESI
jgi:hypothetical protein|tara:strand:- start:1048 stop:1221 length:174 start_codon:yes stop_codon:yes gene_type:complete